MTTVEKRIIDVPQIYPKMGAYSNAIEVRGGRTIYLSGVVGAYPDGTLPKGDIALQADLAYRNLAEVMRVAGGSLADIVKVTILVGEDYPTHAKTLREVRARHFPDGDFPTSTLMRVAGFAGPDYLFEIEAIAVLPD